MAADSFQSRNPLVFKGFRDHELSTVARVVDNYWRETGTTATVRRHDYLTVVVSNNCSVLTDDADRRSIAFAKRGASIDATKRRDAQSGSSRA